MKCLSFFSLALFFFSSCSAQVKKIDETRSEEKSEVRQDSIKELLFNRKFTFKYDTSANSILNKKLSEILSMCQYNIDFKPVIRRKSYCLYFDFQNFSARNDTSSKYFDKIELQHDDKGQLVCILYPDLNLKYKIYEYNKNYQIICIENTHLKDIKLGENYKMNGSKEAIYLNKVIFIIRDKVTQNSIFLETKSLNNFEILPEKLDFLIKLGILNSNLFVMDEFLFNFGRKSENGGITLYRRYDFQGNFNTILFIFSPFLHSRKPLLCTKNTTFKDIYIFSKTWIEEAKKSSKPTMNENFLKEAIQKGYLPAYLW